MSVETNKERFQSERHVKAMTSHIFSDTKSQREKRF